jgi:putative intracellular protease/amidase
VPSRPPETEDARTRRLLVAVLATDGVEQVELFKPVNALRRNNAEFAVAFVRHFVEAGSQSPPSAMLPGTLIEANGVNGRSMTSWASLETDLRNAGALWEDRAVVVDGNLVTSR